MKIKILKYSLKNEVKDIVTTPELSNIFIKKLC